MHITGIDWHTWWTHIIKRDFFTTAVNAKLTTLLTALFVVYFATLLFWAIIYYTIWR